MVTLNTCHPGKAHCHWYEVVYVLGDDAFGIVIFVPKDADAELIEMLQQYTPPSNPLQLSLVVPVTPV